MASNGPPSPSCPIGATRVSQETIENAVNALLKWNHSKNRTQKPQLLDEDQYLYLIVTLKQIPSKGRTNPYRIALPHSLYPAPPSELCLIIDDRSRSRLTSIAAKKKVQSENIPVSKVLKLSKLKTDYREFEKKQKLCGSYDMFLADRRIVTVLPRLLGKHFFKNRKLPLPVDLTHKNWKEQVERVCASALLYLPTGTCCVMRVGRVSMEREEIVENVAAVINGVGEVVPRKWMNVRSLHLKLAESLALPVYQALPDMRLKIEGGNDHCIQNKGGNPREKVEKQGKNNGLNRNLNKGLKKGPRRGKRIDEVRYMDSNVEELVGGDELDIDGDGQRSENNRMASGEFGGKKRRKGGLTNEGGFSRINDEKNLKKVKKVKKEDGVKQKKNGLALKIEEEFGDLKKKKKKVEKSNIGEVKMKDATRKKINGAAE